VCHWIPPWGKNYNHWSWLRRNKWTPDILNFVAILYDRSFSLMANSCVIHLCRGSVDQLALSRTSTLSSLSS
jgi:hypothetical protein